MAALLPEHAFDPPFVLARGSHAPPYDQELGHGIRTAGHPEGNRFGIREFSGGMGVWIAWMNVPRHPRIGKSPDFALGLVIPNGVFPIRVKGFAERDGVPFSTLGRFDVPALEVSTNPMLAATDGYSHFPVFFAGNADFGPVAAPLPGAYLYRLDMSDRLENGWVVEARFAIEADASDRSRR